MLEIKPDVILIGCRPSSCLRMTCLFPPSFQSWYRRVNSERFSSSSFSFFFRVVGRRPLPASPPPIDTGNLQELRAPPQFPTLLLSWRNSIPQMQLKNGYFDGRGSPGMDGKVINGTWKLFVILLNTNETKTELEQHELCCSSLSLCPISVLFKGNRLCLLLPAIER